MGAFLSATVGGRQFVAANGFTKIVVPRSYQSAVPTQWEVPEIKWDDYYEGCMILNLQDIDLTPCTMRISFYVAMHPEQEDTPVYTGIFTFDSVQYDTPGDDSTRYLTSANTDFLGDFECSCTLIGSSLVNETFEQEGWPGLDFQVWNPSGSDDTIPYYVGIKSAEFITSHEMVITGDDITRDGVSIIGGGGSEPSDNIVLSEDSYEVGESDATSQLAVQRSLKAIAGEYYDDYLDLHGVLIENFNGMTDCTESFNAHCVDSVENRMDFACYAILPTDDDTDYSDVTISVTLSTGVTVNGYLSQEDDAYTYIFNNTAANLFVSAAVRNSSDGDYVQAMGISSDTQVLIINAKPISSSGTPIGFKKAVLGDTEYGTIDGTKLSVVKDTQTPISILDDQHLSYVDVFEIDCEDSIVKEDTATDLVWEIQSSLYNSRVNFSTTITAPFPNEAIQSDSLSLGDYSAVCLLATARCANAMFSALETPVTHPVIAIMFSGTGPSDPPSLNNASIVAKAGIEITADDIKKNGISIIGGGGSVEPASVTTAGVVKLTEASGATIFDNPGTYDYDGDNPIVLTASQIKAMILKALDQYESEGTMPVIEQGTFTVTAGTGVLK